MLSSLGALVALSLAAAPAAAQVPAAEIVPATVTPNVAVEPLLAPALAPPAAAVEAAVIPPVAECCTLPALTPVRLEIRTSINSQLVKIGEHFTFRLADPVDVGGVHLPAGIEGSGDVVHAAKSGFAGKPGELILAARYLDLGGTRIPLRSLTFIPGRGQDQTTAAFAVVALAGVAGAVLAMFITGGEVKIPVGTIAYAKTSAPVVLPAPAAVTIEPPLQQGSPNQ